MLRHLNNTPKAVVVSTAVLLFAGLFLTDIVQEGRFNKN